MISKRCMMIGVLLIVMLVGVLAACAAPTPTPTSTSTPTYTPTSTPSGPLAEIIAGAKKEGTVSVKLKSGITPKGIERLKAEIKQRFGVDLNISFTPSGDMMKDVAEAILEYKAGATPTYDLMTSQSDSILTGLKEGVFELLNWSALLPDDVSRCVLTSIAPYGELGLSSYSSQMGMMYNTDKITAAQVPQTLSELADPKWKGKVAIPNYTNFWARRAWVMGKEKTLADLRAILKNNAIQGRFADESNRYMLGEVWMAVLGNSYWQDALAKGVPTAWQNIDFVDEQPRPNALRKGAAHPNAAKLVSIYLATPAGSKFTLEESGGGNACYADNYTHDVRLQGEQQGMPLVVFDQNKALIEFTLSDEFVQWQKEIDLILKMGG